MNKVIYYKPGSEEAGVVSEQELREKDIVKELNDKGFIVEDRRDNPTKVVDEYIRNSK
jgi:hypothetical protein